MGTGRVAAGFVCPSCADCQRQEVLDMRFSERGAVIRLLCAKCERVWAEDTTKGVISSRTSDTEQR